MKLTESEQAAGEWLSQELTGLKKEAAEARLPDLARSIGVDVPRARALWRAFRYEEKFRGRHFKVPESTYDPEVLSEMTDGDTFLYRMGWGAQDGEDGESKAMALAEAAGFLLEYLKRGMLKQKAVWKYLRERLMKEGEKVVEIDGPGAAEKSGTTHEWLACAVVITSGEAVVDVFPEARVRGHQKRSGGRRAIILEACEIRGERLNRDELCRRFAAMLRLYQGGASGIRSQVHLAELSGVTKQAVNDMELRMVQHYRRSTGGRAQFEGVRGKGPRAGRAEEPNSKSHGPKGQRAEAKNNKHNSTRCQRI